MKLSIEQLRHQPITRHALYLVSGDEPLLVGETSYAIRKAFFEAGFCEHLALWHGTANNWEQLEQTLNQGDLFSEQMLIEVHLSDNKIPEKILDLLTDFAQQPLHTRAILIIFDKLDYAAQKTKWFTKLEQHSGFIHLWPLRPHEYPQWLRARCQDHGVTLSNDELASLAELTEGNLVAAAQMIEKLKLLPTESSHSSNRNVNRINDALGDETHFDLFDLNDALLLNQPQRALHILARLKIQHTEPILVLWAITRQARELLQFKQLLDAGQSLPDILQRYRVLPQRRRLVSDAMQRFRTPLWQKSLIYAHLIDKRIKGMEPGDTWLGLEELCLLLMGIEVSLLSLQIQDNYLAL